MAQEIYIFNAKDYVLYPVMKEHFHLSEDHIYKIISDEFAQLRQRLSTKGISYKQLKGALVPNQDRDKFETCLVIDSAQVESNQYGYTVFEKLIPLLDKDSTYSILCGDYIDILQDVENSQIHLRSAMNEVLHRCNPSRYQYSGQYFLIYINRLSATQRWQIIDGLLRYPWFAGFADLTHSSRFKSYLAYILTHAYIKNKKTIIASHPEDYADSDNVNMLGYPFEKYGYVFRSISEKSFGPFLSYKIESEIPDVDDIGFSFNVLFPKFDQINKLHLFVQDRRWEEYLTDQDRKGKLMQTIGYGPDDQEQFLGEIFKKICANYIYCLRQNQFGDLMFDTCIDIPTSSGGIRKTTIGLKYFPESGKVEVVTVT